MISVCHLYGLVIRLVIYPNKRTLLTKLILIYGYSAFHPKCEFPEVCFALMLAMASSSSSSFSRDDEKEDNSPPTKRQKLCQTTESREEGMHIKQFECSFHKSNGISCHPIDSCPVDSFSHMKNLHLVAWNDVLGQLELRMYGIILTEVCDQITLREPPSELTRRVRMTVASSKQFRELINSVEMEVRSRRLIRRVNDMFFDIFDDSPSECVDSITEVSESHTLVEESLSDCNAEESLSDSTESGSNAMEAELDDDDGDNENEEEESDACYRVLYSLLVTSMDLRGLKRFSETKINDACFFFPVIRAVVTKMNEKFAHLSKQVYLFYKDDDCTTATLADIRTEMAAFQKVTVPILFVGRDVEGVKKIKTKTVSETVLDFVEIWDKSVDRRKVQKVVYLPTRSPGYDISTMQYNTWKGIGVQCDHVESLEASDAILKAKPILDHIRHIWCRNDDTVTEYIINWLASAFFQRPGHKLKTALIFIRKNSKLGKDLHWSSFRK